MTIHTNGLSFSISKYVNTSKIAFLLASERCMWQSHVGWRLAIASSPHRPIASSPHRSNTADFYVVRPEGGTVAMDNNKKR